MSPEALEHARQYNRSLYHTSPARNAAVKARSREQYRLAKATDPEGVRNYLRAWRAARKASACPQGVRSSSEYIANGQNAASMGGA